MLRSRWGSFNYSGSTFCKTSSSQTTPCAHTWVRLSPPSAWAGCDLRVSMDMNTPGLGVWSIGSCVPEFVHLYRMRICTMHLWINLGLYQAMWLFTLATVRPLFNCFDFTFPRQGLTDVAAAMEEEQPGSAVATGADFVKGFYLKHVYLAGKDGASNAQLRKWQQVIIRQFSVVCVRVCVTVMWWGTRG